MVRLQKGFTLIEMMIVVAVIGILAAIVYPSYQHSIRNTKRVAAQSEMLEVAKRLQHYKIANFTYTKDVSGKVVPITLNDISTSSTLPFEGKPLYDLSLSGVGASTWVLTATPKSGTLMDGNGSLCLNHRGQKYWALGMGCSTTNLSETSNWDGK